MTFDWFLLSTIVITTIIFTLKKQLKQIFICLKTNLKGKKMFCFSSLAVNRSITVIFSSICKSKSNCRCVIWRESVWRVVCIHLVAVICGLWWPGERIERRQQIYQLKLAETWLDCDFSSFSAANSRCALISLTKSITSGWLNLPSVLSKNSWCVFIQLSRFSYSKACITKSKRSKSFTNFDSGDWFSSYSYKKEQSKIRRDESLFLFMLISKKNIVNWNRIAIENRIGRNKYSPYQFILKALNSFTTSKNRSKWIAFMQLYSCCEMHS